MDIVSSDKVRLLARLTALHEACRPHEPWKIEQEPHDYGDGSTCFTHVVSNSHIFDEPPVKVVIAKHLTPELAELLVLMRNNLPNFINWVRRLGIRNVKIS